MFSALNEYGSDPRSYEYFLGSRENKARTGFELMTSAIPVQRSTNWANKPTGSWSLGWFQINPRSGEEMTLNIRKSYIWTAVEETMPNFFRTREPQLLLSELGQNMLTWHVQCS